MLAMAGALRGIEGLIQPASGLTFNLAILVTLPLSFGPVPSRWG